jgi:CrcB protein
MTHHPYDSHPELPIDPDVGRLSTARPIHTDPSHIAIVAIGAFFGTLARYDISKLLPVGHDGWPTAIMLINLSGSFALGFLLQILLHQGKDVGLRRMARLLLGTGFLGAFTTYSSLATGAVLLLRDSRLLLAMLYVLISLIGGVIAAALGIRTATLLYKQHGARS